MCSTRLRVGFFPPYQTCIEFSILPHVWPTCASRLARLDLLQSLWASFYYHAHFVVRSGILSYFLASGSYTCLNLQILSARERHIELLALLCMPTLGIDVILGKVKPRHLKAKNPVWYTDCPFALWNFLVTGRRRFGVCLVSCLCPQSLFSHTSLVIKWSKVMAFLTVRCSRIQMLRLALPVQNVTLDMSVCLSLPLYLCV